MRIAVIGAGIIGVTTAYELAADGHQVTVFERCGTVAEETSFANAGVLAPGYVTPWAAPGMPGKVLRHLLSAHAPVRFGGAPDAAMLTWLWRWWRACTPETYQRNRSAMHALARYSRARLDAIQQSLRIEYEQARGLLVLLRTERDVALSRAGLKLLAELGVDFHLVDAARCREIEPGLDAGTPLHAGVHLAGDGVGNCRQFAMLLRAEAQRLGVRFRFHHTVCAIQAGAPVSVQTVERTDANQPGVEHNDSFDALVMCAALGSLPLLGRLGMRLPLQPVYGYSLTAPLRIIEGHPDFGPRAALMDEKYKVAISRLGQRVRVAGSAELGGRADTWSKGPLDTLYKVLHDWFPGATHLAQAQRWKGARPMLPDGPPVLGASGHPGVWINLGHGSSGWALSCGSARVLADQIAGRTPEIDTERLSASRLHTH
ncbi:D-amino acid dehydrogenase [Aquincola sp. MAHUQ-54]|uniref:D-amino acid dehydrogenase n=1 Tax=Aquincola agrisoli TaxID=3119538 RepID=A0AAW9Q9U8_9BURK